MRVPVVVLIASLIAIGAGAIASESVPRHYRLAVWPRKLRSPDFILVDESGAHRSLRDYRGRILLVFFGFIQCPDACPIELLKLSQVVKQLELLNDHVTVLFITLDPKHDTSVALKNYLANFDSRFIGLTGTVAEVDEAARNFSVNYAPIATTSGNTIDHSTATYVMDMHGALRLVGSKASNVADFVHDLTLLSAE